MKRHFLKWLEWRRHNLNSFGYQLLVLFKICHSPTFAFFTPYKEWQKLASEALDKRNE